MVLSPRIREQIDACRPGSDDLSLPGLADLASAVEQDRAVAEQLERSQRFDGAVAAAMHEVPLPAGLLERLLVRLDESANSPQESAAAPTVELRPSVPETGARPSRRRWLRAAGGLAAATALAVLVSMWLWPRPLADVSQDQLASRAAGWMADVGPSAEWTPVAGPPADFPQSALRFRPELRTNFRTAEGWSGTAYRALDGRVTVFVFHSPPARVKVPSVPYAILPASQGRAMAAWQTDSRLFVVVLEPGLGPGLEQLIQQPRVT